jgi:hypothetical protein
MLFVLSRGLFPRLAMASKSKQPDAWMHADANRFGCGQDKGKSK